MVIENLRPGVMERLGLGADRVMRGNPHLIYCSLPGFAADDPRAALPAWEGVLGAATGTYWPAGRGALHGACRSRRASGRSPRPWPSSWRSSPGSATASASGSRCRSSTPPCWPSAAGGLLVNGKPDGARPDDPWGGQFLCGDGRWVRLSLATFRFVQRFVEAAGRSDFIEKGYVTPERPGPLARGTELRERQHAELLALFRRRTALEWEDLGRRASVPITMVRTSAEWLAAEHPRTAGVVAEVADPVARPHASARPCGPPLRHARRDPAAASRCLGARTRSAGRSRLPRERARDRRDARGTGARRHPGRGSHARCSPAPPRRARWPSSAPTS